MWLGKVIAFLLTSQDVPNLNREVNSYQISGLLLTISVDRNMMEFYIFSLNMSRFILHTLDDHTRKKKNESQKAKENYQSLAGLCYKVSFLSILMNLGSGRNYNHNLNSFGLIVFYCLNQKTGFLSQTLKADSPWSPSFKSPEWRCWYFPESILY